MSRFFTRCLSLQAALIVAGCSSSTEPVPVTTDAEKIAEYERMIAGDEVPGPSDAEEEEGP